MRMIAGTLLVIGLLAGRTWAESSYDQPYLGKGNANWKRFAGFRGWDKPRSGMLGAALKEADVVCMGTAEKLQGEKDGEDRTWYTGDIKVGEVLKGAVTGPMLRLHWKAGTTSIQDKPSQHLFCLKQGKAKQWEVTWTGYVFPDADYAKMRLYGSYDVDREMGIMAVRAMLNGAIEAKGLKEALNRSFMDERWDEWISATELASELDLKYGGDVLRQAVAPVYSRRDIDVYARAVEALAARGRAAEVQTILEGIPKRAGWGRLPESQAFCVIGRYGGEKAVGTIKAFVKEHPEYVVSAAFTLVEIGGTEAKQTVEKWRNDPELIKRKEKISDGYLRQEQTVGQLLEQATKQMTDR
jgi:hypothetical protein